MMSDNIQEIIIDLLNQASIYGKDSLRIQHLRHVQELILRKDPNLLEHFLEEVLTFQTDKSIEIRKIIISFIEEACQINPKIILRVIDNIQYLLYDENIFVKKKLLLSLCSIYKSTFSWLIKSKSIDENIDRMWQQFRNIKNHIVSQLNSDHDGLCIAIVKFLEMLIITHTDLENTNIEFEHEGKDLMNKLTEFAIDKHISNTNLIGTIESLMNIIRYRSEYFHQILQTLENILEDKLPLNLTESQIDNVRKLIKLKLFHLLKYSISSDHHSMIRHFLNRLGATQTEILKYSELKRKFSSNNIELTNKKLKNIDTHVNTKHISTKTSSSEDQFRNILIRKLSLENVVDLVLHSMHSLPSTMPLSFQSSFMPIIDAGSSIQIKHLAQLLSKQLIENNCDITKFEESVQLNNDENRKEKSLRSKKSKSSKFFNKIQPIESNEIDRLAIDSFYRILHSENICIYKNILSSLVCLFQQTFFDIYKQFLLMDLNKRYDLALLWIYQEYLHENKDKHFTKYDQLLCELLENLQENNRNLFVRLFKQVPYITDNAFLILERVCHDENSFEFGMNILYHLISYRIVIRDQCLDRLISLTKNKNHSIRNRAIDLTKELYSSSKDKCKESIEKYICKFLNTFPSSELNHDEISAESIHSYFSLYFALLPLNHCLFHPLTNLYARVNEKIQQILLQLVEITVRKMDMTNVEILKSMKNCSNGAEPIIVHMISILIEHTLPSDEFIRTIKNFDIHFLIPIINHLEKNDIINSLPKLIQLSPDVVKNIFHKLWISNFSPTELLIALHRISLDECQLKFLIHATSLCFNERSIYTDDILVKIIDELVEINPIPILFMRTVLQTFCLYPKLIDFILKILQRLIIKQAWKQNRLWEGFIKCCEKTRPYSFSLLLQLPPLQLKDILETSNELQENFRLYIRSMSTIERSLISSSILSMIENR